MNALNCRFIGEYEKGEMIGEGTYGIVFFAKDKNTNEQLAIKKMKVLDNQDGFPMTSLREVKILKMLSNHPNIACLR
jgi:serine/threonine protein kinase